MDTKFQPSFIPKKPLIPGLRPERAESVSFFSVVAILIFLLALASSAGAFLYKKYVENKLDDVTSAIKAAEDESQPSLILSLARHAKRIDVAKNLLQNHVAPSAVFALLEKNTVVSTRFTDYQYSSVNELGEIAVNLRGVGESFNAVALQSQETAKSQDFENAVFSGLALDERGNVLFNMNANVKGESLLYDTVRMLGEGTGPNVGLETVEQNSDGIFNPNFE